MDTTEGLTTANISSLSSNSDTNSSSLTPNIKKKGKFKKKGKYFGSKAANSSPDLDIVSGFAFLSFSSLQDLERHMEEHEVQTQSLSISVGQKRKAQSKMDKNEEENVSVRSTSSRIKKPSQKILESYATSDIPIRQLVTSQDSLSKQYGKNIKTSFGEKPEVLLPNIKKECTNKSQPFTSCSSHNLESKNPDISLECSEIIDVCMFDDEDVSRPLEQPVSHSFSQSTEVQEKKRKKKKRKKDINDSNDQTCQTMFRIKKKKKRKDSTTHGVSDSGHNISDSASRTPPESNQTHPTDLGEGSEIKEERSALSPTEQYQQLQATKYFDLKYPRPTISNKVEKINYCARSGGVGLVERHHERQRILNEIDVSSNTSCFQEILPDKDSQDSCDTSIQSDNLSDNESSANSSLIDLDGLPSNKNRIFAGSTSVVISSVESDEVSEVDIGSDTEEDGTYVPINVIKALPKNYLFGHYSCYPDKTTDGTIDVNIQIYENDIQLYMNYAAEFEGKMIKIITPDNEELSKNTNACLPHSSSYSGVPKFLQPQEYVKAVRSATERNRRHNLGDLFTNLKNEIFEEVREFYFSKQAILSQANDILTTLDQQNTDIIKEKEKLVEKNKEHRKRLNDLLYGEDHDLQDKEIDVDKVTEFLKTMDIDIKIPKSSKEKEKAGTSDDICQLNKNVTKKGRPPLDEKFKLRRKHIVCPPSPTAKHELSKNTSAKNPIVVLNKQVKGFIAIAPGPITTESKSMPVKQEKVDVVASHEKEKAVGDPKHRDEMDIAPVNQIVCNISRYRLQQTGECTGMTLVTNPEHPLKAIESKNVVHIKISNDTLKHISGSINLEVSSENLNVSTNDNKITVSDTNLNQESKPLTTCASLSTQTDLDDTEPLSTDCNANTLILRQQVVSSSTLDSNVNPVGSSQNMPVLAKPSMVTPTRNVNPLKNNETFVSSQAKRLLPKPPMVAATASKSNSLGNSQNIYFLPKLPSIAPTPSNVHPPASLQNVMFVPKPSTTGASTTNPVRPNLNSAGRSPNVLLVPQPCTTAINTSAADAIKTTVHPAVRSVLLPKPVGTACNVNPPGCSQNLVLQPIPCTVTVATTNVATVKPIGSPVVSSLLPNPSTTTTGPPNITIKPTAALKRLVDILKGRTLTGNVVTAAKPQVSAFNNQYVITKPTFTFTSQEGVSKSCAPHAAAQPLVTTTYPPSVQVTTNMQPASINNPTEVQPTTLVQPGVPLPFPITMTTTGAPISSLATNVVKHAVSSNPIDQRYVTVMPSPTTSLQPLNLIPSSSVPSSSALRIIFKPTGGPIRNPMEQVQGALQSPRLIRLPIARAPGAPLQATIPVQQSSVVSTATNSVLQAPSLQFLLQKNAQVLQQLGNSGSIQQNTTILQQQQPSLRAISPQISYSTPLVRLQPLQPTNLNPMSTKQVLIPVSPHNVTSAPLSTITASAQPSPVSNSIYATSNLLVNPTGIQPKQQTTTFTSDQLALKSVNMSVSNQRLFNKIPLQQKSMILPTTQSGLGAGQFPQAPFQSNPQLSMPLNVTQKSTTISVSSQLAGQQKKTIFSEMEKMVAKIPSPQLQSTGNNVSTALKANATAASCPQGLSIQSKMGAALTTNVINSSSALQMSTACSNVQPRSLTPETTQSQGCLIAGERSISTQSNVPVISVQTSVTYSSACSSVTTPFQVPQPEHDKTCSVVESPEDYSHVITADALSVCNIDSSIPDITSELQGNQQSGSVTDALFGNISEENLVDACGNGDGKKENSGFVGQDESAAEDFDLLASLAM